jgi:hypothetical protein
MDVKFKNLGILCRGKKERQKSSGVSFNAFTSRLWSSSYVFYTAISRIMVSG